MNLIEIAGHLGADPEERFTSSGKKVVNLRVACRTRKGGQDDTMWYRVTIWDPERYQRMMPYLKKGSALIVVGELAKPEIYTDRNGQPQVALELTAEIIRFSPFGKGENKQEGGSMQQGQPAPVHVQPTRQQQAPSFTSPQPVGAAIDFNQPPSDDDLPF